MAGKSYRVLTEELSYPTDPDVVRRLKAGQNLGWDERKVKVVGLGAIVADIPEVSVPGLIKAGWIEEVKDTPVPVARHSAPNTPTALAEEGGNS